MPLSNKFIDNLVKIVQTELNALSSNTLEDLETSQCVLEIYCKNHPIPKKYLDKIASMKASIQHYYIESDENKIEYQSNTAECKQIIRELIYKKISEIQVRIDTLKKQQSQRASEERALLAEAATYQCQQQEQVSNQTYTHSFPLHKVSIATSNGLTLFCEKRNQSKDLYYLLKVEGRDNCGMWIAQDDPFGTQLEIILNLIQENQTQERIHREIEQLISMLAKNGGYSSLKIANCMASFLCKDERKAEQYLTNLIETRAQCLQAMKHDFEKHPQPRAHAKTSIKEILSFIDELIKIISRFLEHTQTKDSEVKEDVERALSSMAFN